VGSKTRLSVMGIPMKRYGSFAGKELLVPTMNESLSIFFKRRRRETKLFKRKR
jgi:hypothetical protein